MPISEFQYREMLHRMSGSKARRVPGDPVEHEIEDLHKPIIQWCWAQAPRVPYINSRSDAKPTIAKGAPDFVIFYRNNVILVECKAKRGKLSPEQMAWHIMAECQGFDVHIITNLKEFLNLVERIPKP